MKANLIAWVALIGGLAACKYDLNQLAPPSPPDARFPSDRPELPVLPRETVGRLSLAAYWPMEEGDGLYAWDATGNGNDGFFLPELNEAMSVMGPRWGETGFPGALFHNKADVYFDGLDDYIEFTQATLPEIGLSISVSLWARYEYDPGPTDIASLFVLLNRDTAAGLRVELRRQRLRVATYFSTDESPEVVGIEAPRQGWHFVAYTFDGTTHTLYVDDLAPVTSTFLFSERGKPNRCRIGRSSSGVPDAFKGFLDDVRIYDRALTATEVSALRGGAP